MSLSATDLAFDCAERHDPSSFNKLSFLSGSIRCLIHNFLIGVHTLHFIDDCCLILNFSSRRVLHSSRNAIFELTIHWAVRVLAYIYIYIYIYYFTYLFKLKI
jgi:hypothetical protein